MYEELNIKTFGKTVISIFAAVAIILIVYTIAEKINWKDGFVYFVLYTTTWLLMEKINRFIQ